MKRIHVVGRKNHGKTTLVADLVGELSRHGLQIGTIKHTHHHHELDTPGKDSYTHRLAGAKAVGILGPSMSAVFSPRDNLHMSEHDKYAHFVASMSFCDLVIVEGDTHTSAPKLEVWRSECGTVPLALEIDGISAIITDDETEVTVPRFSRSSLVDVIQWILTNHVHPKAFGPTEILVRIESRRQQ